jgi:hypothetical protein
LEKVAEIKRINAQMMAVKSEISKYEDTLKEYQLYKKFLDALTPQVRSWLHYIFRFKIQNDPIWDYNQMAKGCPHRRKM